MIRTKLALALAIGLAAVGAAPAGADNVTVAVDNPGGSRTLYVENLLGQPLTTLDFGASRTQPFRVRVVDSTMDRASFTVSATMTNLYLDTGAGLDFTKAIASSNLQIVNPLHPLNALSVAAVVQPVFDTVSTITDTVICTTLSLTVVGGACTVALADLQGKLQTLPLTVDLAALGNLPLLPQAAEPGAFTNPDYAGVAASATDKPASPPPATARRMLKGTPVSDATVLSALQAVLNTVLAAQPLSDKVDTGTVTAALKAQLGPAYDLLTTTQVQTILNSTVATVEALVASQVKAQTGTYLSFPTLSVTVPSTAPAGSYKGTLVVTGLQA